jgi:hypothetical protein
MYVLRVDEEEFHTILAALRYYQERGQGGPFNRSARIHEIATNSGAVMSSLDEDGIDQLCERLNTECHRDDHRKEPDHG